MNYYEQINEMLDEIFIEADNLGFRSWVTLAQKSGISIATVYNIGNRKTRSPHYRTVYLLAKAVGMHLTLSKNISKRKTA